MRSLSVVGTVSTVVKQQPWLEAIWGRWAPQALLYAFKYRRIPECPALGLCEKQVRSQRDFTTKMLTHSVTVDVWDVSPMAWLWFWQWRLSALQISHGGPMGTCVVHPTISRRGASLLFDRRRQIQMKTARLCVDTF
ncbi:hypothetical protein PAMP_007488 [Pampus punctatissimus]